MSRRRTTFGKLQRDRDKQAKARAKADKRAARAESRDEAGPTSPPPDQAAILASLAALHADYEEGRVSLEDFEERREALTQALRVD